jgi:formate hydrogenlyase transcriptional activator
LATLCQHDWPGNIRELQNVIERVVILSSGPDLDLPAGTLRTTSISQTGKAVTRTLADAERDHILATLQHTGGVVGGAHGAAALLGLPRTTLIARMRKLGISHGKHAVIQPVAVSEMRHEENSIPGATNHSLHDLDRYDD